MCLSTQLLHTVCVVWLGLTRRRYCTSRAPTTVCQCGSVQLTPSQVTTAVPSSQASVRRAFQSTNITSINRCGVVPIPTPVLFRSWSSAEAASMVVTLRVMITVGPDAVARGLWSGLWRMKISRLRKVMWLEFSYLVRECWEAVALVRCCAASKTLLIACRACVFVG